jgi:hypothetical protein
MAKHLRAATLENDTLEFVIGAFRDGQHKRGTVVRCVPQTQNVVAERA